MPSPESPVPWETLKGVLGDALELPAAERVEWVRGQCSGNVELCDAVLALLPEETEHAGFMESPALVATIAREPKSGDQLGHYRLGKLLGEGGMGQVFEATQERPQRTVALKVLRPGLFSEKAARRFEWEAEVLGKLAHRAIARILEAGEEVLPDGNRLSWFAMEQVQGDSMLRAAEVQGLDRRARLELFLHVCDGVSHAHQRGIIHRDLKPDNVLVDETGRPHILDFGIARSLDPEDPHQTMEGDIIGTLAYMSPEQVQGDLELIDVRTDVFSLGVILYRMLTGRAPHELKGLTVTEVARRLTEENALPAGQVDSSLRGDLETILGTALAREPERRYASVDGLAGDLRAYLEDRPISARPPTAMYHLSMFARRHKILVAAASMIVVLLVAAIVGTTFGLNKATHARDLAQLERDRAQATLSFITKVFRSADPEEGGRDILLVDLLETAALDLEADQSL
ncbi:MAG: serine/threonine-protein kinase, partial [Planctomycetota bacterium]|nr:serine/threonine-protein kinase [Planctomycetota bacterium]